MALTRITKGVIKPNENYDTHNINSTGIITAVGGNFSGNVSVGGVLTYEDVTSIDSVGIITAQKDIHVGAGVSAVGVGTFGSLDIGGDIDVDGHTNLDNVNIAGVTTTSGKIDVYGDLVLPSSGKSIKIWTGGTQGITLGHGGTFGELDNLTGMMRIKAGSINLANRFGNYNFINCASYGSVDLYYDAQNHTTPKLATSATGVTIDGTAVAGGLDISGDIDVDGHTNLDNVSIAGVTTTTDDINLPNNKKAKFGSFGFQMYQNTSGSNNAIIEQTASGQFLRLKTNGGALSIEADSVNLRNSANSTQTAIFSAGGKTSLYYNSNLKFTTETGGVNITGVCTATSFSGDGSNLTGITGTTINNNANNRIITGSGTANTLEAETSLEWNGTDTLTVVHPSSYSDFKVRTSAGGGSFEMFSCGNGPFRIRSSSTSPNSNADELVIGATNGTRGLTIFGATNNIFFGDADDNDVGQIQYLHSDNSMRFTTNTTERVRITSGGAVGINETAPSAMLHVENDNANSSTYYLNTDAAILVQNKNSNATAKTVIKLEGPAGSGDCALVYGAGSTNMIFADRQNERLRIDSSGRIGVGVVPTAQFDHNLIQIGNQATLGANAALSTTGQTFLTHNLYFDPSGNYQVFNTSNANEGAIIRLVDGNFLFSNSAQTTGTPTVIERLRIASDGTTTASGTSDGVLQLTTTDSRGAFIRFGQGGSYHNMVGCADGLTSGDKEDLGIRAADNIIFAAGGSSEKLRIDSTGRIGSQHNLSGTADYNRLMLHNPHSGSCWMQMTSTATGYNPNTDGLSIGLNTSNIGHFWLRENADIYVGTNNTRRWTITSSGDLYPQGNYNIGLNSNTAFRMNEVNSTKFVHRYGVSGSATTNQREAIWYGGGITVMHDNLTLQTTNYTWGLTGVRGYALLRIRNGAGSPQAIYAEAGSISSGSDYRMKENIEEITNGIETVKKLKPSIYNIRKSYNPNDDGKKHHGFIAHEVQEAIPNIGNIVSGVKDGMEEVFYQDDDENIPEGKKPGDSTGTFTDNPDMQGIDYGHMTPVLAAAIKELIAKVESLEAEVASLKST